MDANTEDKSSEVYIGNLHHEITVDELESSISFENCNVLRLIKKDIKAFCFVDCGSYENAVKFYNVMDGRDLKGRRMKVKLNDKSTGRNVEKSSRSSYDHSSSNNSFCGEDINKKSDVKRESKGSPAYVTKPNTGKNIPSSVCDAYDDDGPPPLRPNASYEPRENAHELRYASSFEHISPKDFKYQTSPTATYEPINDGRKLGHISPCNHYTSQCPHNSMLESSKCLACSPQNCPASRVSIPRPTPQRLVDEQPRCLHDTSRSDRDLKYNTNHRCVDSFAKSSMSQPQEYCHNCHPKYNQSSQPLKHGQNVSHFNSYDMNKTNAFSGYRETKHSFTSPHTKSHFSKSNPKDFKQPENYSRQSSNMQHFYKNASHYQENRETNERFTNIREHHTNQLRFRQKAVDENYESEGKEGLISRIRDLRLYQANSYKSTNNYSSYGSMNRGNDYSSRGPVNSYSPKGPVNNYSPKRPVNNYSSKGPVSSHQFSPKSYNSPAYQDNATEEENDDDYSDSIVLSVANFPYRTTEEMIFELFEDYEPIEIMMVCNEPADIPTEALVLFGDEDHAISAIMELDNTVYRHRTIFVTDVSDDSVLEELQRVN